MDGHMLVYLLSTLFFILIGVLVNYPRKNKKGTGDDSRLINQNLETGDPD
jgi:hypothetical protein